MASPTENLKVNIDLISLIKFIYNLKFNLKWKREAKVEIRVAMTILMRRLRVSVKTAQLECVLDVR